MSEFIEKEKLLSLIEKWQNIRSNSFNEKDNIVINAIKFAIAEQPTTNIIICKDCKYRKDRLYCRRTIPPFITTNTDFCSFGEANE